MPRRYREISYLAPLREPLETPAWLADSDSDWRLVVFAGTPARKYLFERFLRLAPPDIEVVMFARPGYARGHRRVYPDFEDQVAAARPFLDGSKKVVTLGVSYGGALALKAALDFPEAVRGVVTVAALVTEPRPWVQPFVDLGGAPVVRDFLPRTLHHARAEVAGRRAQIGPLFTRLKELRAPVTILHGDLDHLVAFSDAEALRGFFAPGADIELARVRGGTHFLEMQFPQRLYAAARSVIARVEKAVKTTPENAPLEGTPL